MNNNRIRVRHQAVVVVVHQNLIEAILRHLFHQLSKYFDCKSSCFSYSLSRHEHVQNDEQENHLLIEDPVLASHCIDDSNHLLSTGETKEEVFSSEMVIKHNNENETTPVINEYDLPNNGQESRYQKTFSFLFSFIYI